MSNTEILFELSLLIKKVFGNSNILVFAETRPEDVKEWDSVNNVLLLLAIERHFKVRFNFLAIQPWKSVGHLSLEIERLKGM